MFGSLPPAVRRKVLPLLLPPAARGSAFAPRRKKAKRRRARAAQDLQPNCGGHQRLAGTIEHSDGYLEGRWTSIVTADGNARVHYVDWRPARPLPSGYDPGWAARTAVEQTQESRAAAMRFAAAMPGIWRKLSARSDRPRATAASPATTARTKFDIYVGGGIADAVLPGAPAVTRPYPAVGNFPVRGQSCTDRPAFMAVKRYVDPFTLAHEFMHAIQFAHRG